VDPKILAGKKVIKRFPDFIFMSLTPGLTFREKYVVTSEYTAKHLGSGSVEVLATPAMILFMEHTCRVNIDNFLLENRTTVGTHVDVYHVKPAPINSEVVIEAKLLQVDGRKLIFYVAAYWGDKLIGYGIHERYIVDKEEFAQKIK